MKNKFPTDKEIQDRIEIFKQKISEVSHRPKKKNSSANQFLTEIESILKIEIEKNISFPQIARDIFQIFHFKVSPQTIKKFAISNLGYSPKRNPKLEDYRDEDF